MGNELLLKGQRVLPQKLNKAGYIFEYDNIEKALNNIFNSPHLFK
jgi:NAD dependent epimerase/dehydratase family enzyme